HDLLDAVLAVAGREPAHRRAAGDGLVAEGVELLPRLGPPGRRPRARIVAGSIRDRVAVRSTRHDPAPIEPDRRPPDGASHPMTRVDCTTLPPRFTSLPGAGAPAGPQKKSWKRIQNRSVAFSRWLGR